MYLHLDELQATLYELGCKSVSCVRNTRIEVECPVGDVESKVRKLMHENTYVAESSCKVKQDTIIYIRFV